MHHQLITVAMLGKQVLTVDCVRFFRKAGRIAHTVRSELAAANIHHFAAVEQALRGLEKTLWLMRVLESMLVTLDTEHMVVNGSGMFSGRSRVIEQRS
jgi:hypothetical protein